MSHYYLRSSQVHGWKNVSNLRSQVTRMFGESEYLWKVVFLCVTCTFWNDVMGMPQYETGHTDGHLENLGVIDPSVVFYDQGGLYSGLVAADVPETVT